MTETVRFVPEIALSDTGDYAELTLGALGARKLYWGYVGEQPGEYTRFDEFEKQAGATFTADYGPGNGGSYTLTQSGYYRFVVVYTDEVGTSYDLIYTVKID